MLEQLFVIKLHDLSNVLLSAGERSVGDLLGLSPKEASDLPNVGPAGKPTGGPRRGPAGVIRPTPDPFDRRVPRRRV